MPGPRRYQQMFAQLYSIHVICFIDSFNIAALSLKQSEHLEWFYVNLVSCIFWVMTDILTSLTLIFYLKGTQKHDFCTLITWKIYIYKQLNIYSSQIPKIISCITWPPYELFLPVFMPLYSFLPLN